MYSQQFPNRLPKVKEWESWTCGQTKSSITSGGHARVVMTILTIWRWLETMLLVNNCSSSNARLSYLQTKWISVLHHVCGEHQWNTGECEHEELDGPPTENDKVIPYFKNTEAPFQSLQKVILNSKWLESMKYYTRFRLVGHFCTYILSLTQTTCSN